MYVATIHIMHGSEYSAPRLRKGLGIPASAPAPCAGANVRSTQAQFRLGNAVVTLAATAAASSS